MKLILALFVGLMAVSPAMAGNIEIVPEMTSVNRVKVAPDHRYPWYKEQYSYMFYKDTVFSAESEFDWPEGYKRIDEKRLSPYQSWVSHLPLWHSQRPVGSLFSGFVFTPDKISRPIHLTRWKTRFSDQTIALHLWAEYLKMRGRQKDFKVFPMVGDTMRYAEFLSGTLAFGSRGQVVYTKSDKRKQSHDEFVAFMELCDQQSTYKSLAENCLPVAKDSLFPGDMYITFNEEGVKGRVIFLLTMIVDSSGRKLYTIGAGCEKECDFYIPLLNGDKNYPWISVDQIAALYPPMDHAGYFRPKIK
jgi:hypothetical protein